MRVGERDSSNVSSIDGGSTIQIIPKTLRTRVLWLFITLALGPFLVASVVQYRQAADDRERAAITVASAVATLVTQQAEQVHAEATADAESMADFVRAGGPLAEWAPQFPTSVLSIELRGGNGQILGTWQRAGSLSAMCSSAATPAFFFTTSIPLDEGAADAWSAIVSVDPSRVASASADYALLGTDGWIELEDGVGGVFSTLGCLEPAVSARAENREAVEALPSHVTTAYVPGTSVPWTAKVAVDPTSIGSRSGTTAWFLGVAAITALVATILFTLLLSGVTRSLEDLAQAADRVGQGDFSPWLPPPGNDEAGRLSLAIGRMVDRLREMLEKVKRTGQMAAIGEMASYVAHEIRNPLNSLRLNLQSVERSAKSGGLDLDDMDSLSLCLREVGRLDRVVSGVLRLSRPAAGEVNLTSLNAVVGQAAYVLAEELDHKDIDVTLDLDAEEDWIRADAQQIEAAIINLLLNGAEAAGPGGTVAVETRSVLIGEEPCVELLVSDSGPGVPVELRPRIFEPFFTTKPMGSGLGLAVVMRTVEEHGGRMRLDEPSGLGQGATFRITFPALAIGREPSVRRWTLVGLDKPTRPWARFPNEELGTPVTLEEDAP